MVVCLYILALRWAGNQSRVYLSFGWYWNRRQSGLPTSKYFHFILLLGTVIVVWLLFLRAFLKIVSDISICSNIVYDIIGQPSGCCLWLAGSTGSVAGTTLRSPIGLSDCFDQRTWLNGWFWLYCCHTGRFRSRCLGERVITFLRAWLPKC